MKVLLLSLFHLLPAGIKRLLNTPLLFISILIVITFGLIGFSKIFPDFSFLTWLYMTMQLFLLDPQTFDASDVAGGNGADIPWTLEVARWLAAIITFYGIILTAWKILKVSNDKLRIQQMRNHTVVWGSGEVVRDMMDEALASRKDHALITHCSQTLSEWRAVGLAGLEITNDARIEKETLISAGIQHASEFYVLGTSDPENLHAALQAAAMDGSCHIVLRQDEPFACDLLQRNPPLPAKCRHSLRVISIEKSRARTLINNYPLEWDAHTGYANEVHLILPQLGAFQKSVAIQAALVGHYKNGMRVNIWLDSPDSKARLLADFPGIRHCLNLNALGENGIDSITSIASSCRNGSLITILADHLTPEEAYIQTIKLREAWPKNLAFRTIISRIPSGTPPFVADHPNLVVAPEVRGLITPENLAKLDRVAKQIHNTWYQGNQRRIDEAITKADNGLANQLSAKSTFKVWDELTEEQRDSNRNAADHIEIKFRGVGIDCTHPDLEKAWKNLTHDQIELLSRMEHDRWAAPLWLGNYCPGVRDDSHRQHPNLVPYDELDQSTKDYDAEQVKMAADYFTSTCK